MTKEYWTIADDYVINIILCKPKNHKDFAINNRIVIANLVQLAITVISLGYNSENITSFII